MILGVVWHWWIAPVLVTVVILAILGTVAGYLKQVTSTRYPPRR